MKIRKRFLICIAAICCVCLIAGIGFKEYQTVSGNWVQNSLPVVIIDAGHGGFDGGAVASDGTVEKDINLNIAMVLRRFVEQSGFNVIMTRTSDSATDDVETKAIAVRKKSDLKNRLELMRDYPDAIFVSIHLNKFTTSAASGAQVFYSKTDSRSKTLGECIQKSVVGLLQPENTRVIKQGTDSTYLLKNATVPAVIVECGFLSNHSELEKLKNEEYQSKMAFAVYCGILEYYGGT